MSKILTIVIIVLTVLISITVIGTTIQTHEESKEFCENIEMELYGWVPDGVVLTCRGIENEQIILIKFQRVNGKYYPVKEAN